MYHGLEFLVPLVLFTSFGAGTEYSTRCADEGTPDLVFRPLRDVAGRYSLEWCAHIDGKVLSLEIDLFWSAVSKAKCVNDNTSYFSTERLHSSFRTEWNDTINCNRVCFLSNIDLVYAGCYNLQYKVTRQSPACAPHTCTSSGNYLQYVDNNYTADYFISSSSIADDVSFDGDISVVTFNFGYIPVTDFKVYLCNESVATAAPDCSPGTAACRVAAVSAVRCEWRVPPGNYSAVFTHLAPWTHGDRRPEMEYRRAFSHLGPPPAPRVGPAPRTLTSSLTWSAGACAVLAAVAAAALFVRRRRRRGNPVPDSEIESGAASELSAPATDILLLYARDSEQFCEAMKQLRQLLQETSSGQVHDLYSASTVALLACDAAGWLRGTLRRARTLVVLTPYLALNASGYDEKSEHFKRSLLGSEVLYSEPLVGDQLLTVALDQLRRYCAGAGGDFAEYERVIVAEFPSQPTALFTDLASLTRYALPGDLAPLVCRLCAPAPAPAPALAAAAAARAALTEYAAAAAAAAAGGRGAGVAGRLQALPYK